MKLIVLTVLTVAVVAACGGPAQSTPAATTTPAQTAAAALAVKLMDFKIEPSTLTVGAGAFTVSVSSDGPTPHNFTIRDGSENVVVASNDLSAGESDSVDVDALPAGDYTFFCSFAGHESLGMHGTLTVTQ